MRRAVLLDRDGTLIEDVGYPSRPEDVRILPGVPGALADLRGAGFLLVVVTNQSGIGRGLLTEEDYERVSAATEEAVGVALDGAYHCPHRPDRKCSCRKPAPGMLQRASREMDFDLTRSWAVGDRARDAEAGLAAGCRAILIGDEPLPAGAHRAAGLSEAARIILTEPA